MFGSRKFCATLCVGFILWVSGIQGFRDHQFKVGGLSPGPFQAPSPNTQASHVLSLTRQVSGISRSAGYVQSLRRGSDINGVYGVAPLTSVEEGTVFLTGVKFGAESFQAVVDTGTCRGDIRKFVG